MRQITYKIDRMTDNLSSYNRIIANLNRCQMVILCEDYKLKNVEEKIKVYDNKEINKSFEETKGNIINFGEETRKAIKIYFPKNRVSEFKIQHMEDDITFFGRGNIHWALIGAIVDLNYDMGYGIQYYDGWITFEDSFSFLEREECDGNEWWGIKSIPKLDPDLFK